MYKNKLLAKKLNLFTPLDKIIKREDAFMLKRKYEIENLQENVIKPYKNSV